MSYTAANHCSVRFEWFELLAVILFLIGLEEYLNLKLRPTFIL